MIMITNCFIDAVIRLMIKVTTIGGSKQRHVLKQWALCKQLYSCKAACASVHWLILIIT